MFNFVRKSSLFVGHLRHATLTLRSSPIHEFQQCLPLSTTATTKQQSLTVSYLVNTYGFSPEYALSVATVSNQFQINDPDKAEEVISFFESHGFSQIRIWNIIRKFPDVLLYDPEKTLYPRLIFYYLKSFYGRRASTKPQSLTVSYLVTTCGLSLLSAELLSLEFKLESPYKADAVISLFKSHGFSQTNISNLIRQKPKVLLYDPEKTLSPKLEFLYSKGFSSHDVANIIAEYPPVLSRSLKNHLTPKLEFFYSKGFSSSDFAKILCEFPYVLDMSLEKRIIPSFNCLSKLFESQERTIALIKRGPNILCSDVETDIAPAINILLENGVSISNISRYYCLYDASSIEELNLFKKVVAEVKEMGIDPSAKQFAIAVNLKFGMPRSEWKDQVNIYKRWGWSEEEFLEAFRKYPQIMCASEDKIMALMDFFVNKMGLEPSYIAKHPNIVGCNSIRRIIPRAAVFHFLLTKSLIKSKHDGLDTLFRCNEKTFLEKFVNPYDEAPQLLKLYEHKLIQARSTHDYNSIGKIFDLRLDFSWCNFN